MQMEGKNGRGLGTRLTNKVIRSFKYNTHTAKPSAFDVCFGSLSDNEMKMFNFKNFVQKVAITLSLWSYVML